MFISELFCNFETCWSEIKTSYVIISFCSCERTILLIESFLRFRPSQILWWLSTLWWNIFPPSDIFLGLLRISLQLLWQGPWKLPEGNWETPVALSDSYICMHTHKCFLSLPPFLSHTHSFAQEHTRQLTLTSTHYYLVTYFLFPQT
jgi:hypothetical protein